MGWTSGETGWQEYGEGRTILMSLGMMTVVVSNGLSGRKHEAFDSAARAIMMDETPVCEIRQSKFSVVSEESGLRREGSQIEEQDGPVNSLIRSKSHMPTTSPLAVTGIPYRSATSTMSLSLSINALSVLRIVFVLAWTVRFLMPV